MKLIPVPGIHVAFNAVMFRTVWRWAVLADTDDAGF
jgi:hypothetical protein